MASRWTAVLLVAVGGSLAASAEEGEGEAKPALEFRHTFTTEPLNVAPAPNEVVTPAVTAFLSTGESPYARNRKAQRDGAELFRIHCSLCHGVQGVGRMGPSLTDEKFQYSKNRSDKGLFETIYGGAGGSMTAFRGRMTIDQILKVIAYLQELKNAGGPSAPRTSKQKGAPAGSAM